MPEPKHITDFGRYLDAMGEEHMDSETFEKLYMCRPEEWPKEADNAKEAAQRA